MCVGAWAKPLLHVYEAEDNLQVLSFHHVVSRNQTQVISLADKALLYLLSNLLVLFSDFHETINTQIQVQKSPNVRNKKKVIPMNTIIQSLQNFTKVL